MNTPRISPWNEVNDDVVASWTAVEVLLNLHRQLQQSAAVSFGYGKPLAEGAYNFADEEQKEALRLLYIAIERMHKLTRWMTLWILMRTDEEGNWCSDDAGKIAIRSVEEICRIIDSYSDS